MYVGFEFFIAITLFVQESPEIIIMYIMSINEACTVFWLEGVRPNIQHKYIHLYTTIHVHTCLLYKINENWCSTKTQHYYIYNICSRDSTCGYNHSVFPLVRSK